MIMHKVKLATLLINLTYSASLFAAGGINSGFSGSGGINRGPATSNDVATAGAAMVGGTNNFTGPNSFTNTGNSFVGNVAVTGGNVRALNTNSFYCVSYSQRDITFFNQYVVLPIFDNYSFNRTSGKYELTAGGDTVSIGITNGDAKIFDDGAVSGLTSGFMFECTNFSSANPSNEFKPLTNWFVINAGNFGTSYISTNSCFVFFTDSYLVLTSLNSTISATPTSSKTPAPPMYGWNSFGNDAGGQTEIAFSNTVTFYKTIGLDKYIKTYMLDHGWENGRSTNGTPQPTAAYPSGIPFLSNFIHTNILGGKFWAHEAGVDDFSLSGTIFGIQGYETLDANYFIGTVKVDGLSIDNGDNPFNTSTVVNDRIESEYAASVLRLISVASNNPIQININFGHSYAKWNSYIWISTVADGWDFGQDGDTSNVDPNTEWTDNDKIFSQIQNEIPYIWKGHYPLFSTLGLFQGDTNKLAGALSRMAIIPASFFLCETNFTQTNGVMNLLTNHIFLRVHQDLGGNGGFLIQSNSDGSQVFGRNLLNNEIAVALYNPSGSSASLGFTWAQINVPNDYQFIAQVFPDGTNQIVSGSWTNTVGSKSGKLILLTPYLATTFYYTNLVNGVTNQNLTTHLMQYTIPVVVTEPAATLGSAEIRVQTGSTTTAWTTVDEASLAGGATSIIATNEQTFVVNLPSGWFMRITNNLLGTGYTAGIDNSTGKTNTVTFFP